LPISMPITAIAVLAAMHRPAARVSYIWFLLNWSAR